MEFQLDLCTKGTIATAVRAGAQPGPTPPHVVPGVTLDDSATHHSDASDAQADGPDVYAAITPPYVGESEAGISSLDEQWMEGDEREQFDADDSDKSGQLEKRADQEQ